MPRDTDNKVKDQDKQGIVPNNVLKIRFILKDVISDTLNYAISALKL